MTTISIAPDPLRLLRANVGGPGQITGTVAIAATGAPLERRVRLMVRRTGQLVNETWSDKEGNYIFRHLRLNMEFVVYALDFTSTYSGAIADRVEAKLP